MERLTFRFDDVCLNTNLGLLMEMTEHLYKIFPDCEVIYGISPMVHDMYTGDEVANQRVFPEVLNAMSDYRNFYKVDNTYIPVLPMKVTKAGHGLVHVDHRLLCKGAQELSIIASCSLAKAKKFIPPFNKWNKDTEAVCKENGIELIKFEDGWLSMEYNNFNSDHKLWYLHSREWTFEKFVAWFQ